MIRTHPSIWYGVPDWAPGEDRGGTLGEREVSHKETADALIDLPSNEGHPLGARRGAGGTDSARGCADDRTNPIPDPVRPGSGDPLRGRMLRAVHVPDHVHRWREGRIHARLQRLRAAVHRLRRAGHQLVD